jgi:hypothetical protein
LTTAKRDLETRLRALRPADPSANLRARVLAAASGSVRPRLALADRVWASPWLRLSWAAAVVILIAAESVIVRIESPRPAPVVAPAAAEPEIEDLLAGRPEAPDALAREVRRRLADTGGPNELDPRWLSKIEAALQERS